MNSCDECQESNDGKNSNNLHIIEGKKSTILPVQESKISRETSGKSTINLPTTENAIVMNEIMTELIEKVIPTNKSGFQEDEQMNFPNENSNIEQSIQGNQSMSFGNSFDSNVSVDMFCTSKEIEAENPDLIQKDKSHDRPNPIKPSNESTLPELTQEETFNTLQKIIVEGLGQTEPIMLDVSSFNQIGK